MSSGSDEKEALTSTSSTVEPTLSAPPKSCRMIWIYLFTFVIGFGTLAGLAVAVQHECISLHGPATASDLYDFPSKLQFTLQFWSLPLIWLVFSIAYVIYRRVTTKTINPLAANQETVHEANCLLRNGVEQIALLTLTQLALLPHLDAEMTLKLIPTLNIQWLVGRIAFFIGYPNNRLYGWILSFYGTLPVSIYAVYLFIRHHFQI